MDERKIDSQLQLPSTANHVRLIGLLDRQMIGGRTIAKRLLRNEVQGYLEQIQLQLATPFGRSFALLIDLEQAVLDLDLLNAFQIGDRIALTGRLAWQQRIDSRFPVLEQRVRTANDLVVQPIALARAEPTEQLGSFVRVSGTVLDAPRMLRHPTQSAMLLAATVLRVEQSQSVAGSRVRMLSSERIPIVIPVNHPEVGYLLRPGNQVVIEGMLERITIPIAGTDVDLALTILDAEWQDQQRQINPTEQHAELRRYQRERRRLGEITRMRVVAGYVELLDGSPATIREGQAMRRKKMHQRNNQRRSASAP